VGCPRSPSLRRLRALSSPLSLRPVRVRERVRPPPPLGSSPTVAAPAGSGPEATGSAVTGSAGAGASGAWAASPAGGSAMTSENLPSPRTSATSTHSLSPTLTASSAWLRRRPSGLGSLEMCSSPSEPGTSEMNEPKSAFLTTVP